MKILLSSIGTRGDVQPLVALGLELRALGHDVRLCVAPNFKEWIQSCGLTCIPIGPDLKKMMGASAASPKVSAPMKPTREQRHALAAYTVRNQFETIGEVARDCDLILGAGALQIAAPSIAAALKRPYVFASYCPAVLPSSAHPPTHMTRHYPHWLPGLVNRALWMKDEHGWNILFRAALNEERAKLGLAPVASVRPYVFGERPWLAADPTLGPAPPSSRIQITQTGAWMLSEQTPLPEPLETFLASGEPPVYLGFGSMRAPPDTGRVLIEAVRALGRRFIVSQGWGNIAAIDANSDCISIGDVNHAKLFPRVAAIVHHGGAGTTSAAARAGTPQVIVPHHYDQHYWAHRVQTLGIGVSGPTRGHLTATALSSALRSVLRDEVKARAQAFAVRMELHGAAIAAQRLVAQ